MWGGCPTLFFEGIMQAIGDKVIVKIKELKQIGSILIMSDDRMQREGTIVSIGSEFNKNANLSVGDMVTFVDTAQTFVYNGVKYAVLNEESLYFKLEDNTNA